MLFCPKCGSMMTAKTDKGKKVLACSCGYTNKKQEAAAVREVVANDKKKGAGQILSDENPTLPLTEEVCPKCGHDQAYWWTKQMRSSDEPETKFLKCEKCKHTWRDRS